MGKFLDNLLKLSIVLNMLFALISVLFIFGIVFYYTKKYVDNRNPQYTDGEKAGIYIGVAIPTFLLSLLIFLRS